MFGLNTKLHVYSEQIRQNLSFQFINTFIDVLVGRIKIKISDPKSYLN